MSGSIDILFVDVINFCRFVEAGEGATFEAAAAENSEFIVRRCRSSAQDRIGGPASTDSVHRQFIGK